MLLAALVLIARPGLAGDTEQFGDIRFVTPGPTITTLPMEVARARGFDKEEGFAAVFSAATGSVAT
jgi:hypothetical protein